MANALTKHFFCGGNCTFTVKVPEAFASHNNCNLHYTFKIECAEPNDRFPNPAHFVKLLTGPNNTEDFSYLGMLDPNTGEVRLTIRSCAGSASWAVRIVRRVLAQIFEGDGMPGILKHGWDVDHMGKCGRCGRPLTVPESIDLGIGPDCADQMGIPYPTRTKAKRPRKAKVVAEESAAVSAGMVNEAGPITGDLPALPDDEIFF